MANSSIIIATLIATIVFADGFPVADGNNSDNGIPILLKLYRFRSLSYQMIKVALRCSNPSPTLKPKMSAVMNMLEDNVER
ncbi:hypothetical protein RDI58_022110 [Solanum bulbocastanum]|uniref:PGG domain-containing protein n=1 Tax=Solanum bulbocastanum TaxID=147425 RepID=A0AAN8T771_SOLBU